MRILIQAGHKGRTSGSTGAPGEQRWTSEIVPKIATRLRDKGFEVSECNADPTDADISGDWDLFLSVHYDADVYNDRGGFIDIPDPSVDMAHTESMRIAGEIRKTYFPITGIPEKPQRSNANTKFYYMWKRMSAKTPCVILEAGVGWRTPQDHQTLWFEQDKVVEGVTKGIINALKPEPVDPPVDPCEELEKEVKRLTEDNQRLRKELENIPIIGDIDLSKRVMTGSKDFIRDEQGRIIREISYT